MLGVLARFGGKANWEEIKEGLGVLYKFLDDGNREAFEARYYSANGFSLAVIAVVNRGVDWAAYIGADNSLREEDTLCFVLEHGCKLSEDDARHYFRDIQLPYGLWDE